jgi:hypothetical protein
MILPPAMSSVVPVIQDDASAARNKAPQRRVSLTDAAQREAGASARCSRHPFAHPVVLGSDAVCS